MVNTLKGFVSYTINAFFPIEILLMYYRAERLTIGSGPTGYAPSALDTRPPNGFMMTHTQSAPQVQSQNSFFTAQTFETPVLAPDSQPTNGMADITLQDTTLQTDDPDSLPFGPTSFSPNPVPKSILIDDASAPSVTQEIQTNERPSSQPSIIGIKRKDPSSRFSSDSSLSELSEPGKEPPFKKSVTQSSLPEAGLKSSTSSRRGSSRVTDGSSKRNKAATPQTPLRQSARIRNRIGN